MEKYFELRDYFDNSKVAWAAYQLAGEAATWWENKRAELGLAVAEVTWDQFVRIFQQRWLAQLYYDQKLLDFENLRQGPLILNEYWEKYTQLLKYVPRYQ